VLSTDIEEVLIPEAAAYDSNHASYLQARLRGMRRDIILLEQGIGDLAKRLIEAYRTKGEWTDEEGIDAQVVRNLIDRLRDYGVLQDEDDLMLDAVICEELRRKREKLGAK
jgi:hypothetical protein